MPNRRAVLAAIAGAASLALTMSACGGQDSGASSEGGTIGIAMPTRASERWLTDGKSIVQELKDKGYKTKLVYGEDDPETQVAQIEKLIKQGVAALIIAAIDNKALNGALQHAADADIPVISYDRLILGTKNVDYYVSFDNEQVGRLQARYIIEKLRLEHGKGPFNIELFAGSPDDNNTKYFFDGAMHLLQPYLDSKQLVVRSGQTELDQITTLRWDGPTAEKRMNKILAESYGTEKVDAILSPYDGISIGVLSALKSDGYGSGSKPLPVVTGQDAELASVKSIIAGEQSQTVYKDLRQLAEAAANMADDILNGDTPQLNNRRAYNNGVKAVPAYLLQPTSVDKANYENVLIGGDYYTAAELK
ncbi:sugar ABC transporter substrate-binding protein [Streptomyces ipomoeae]|jgi:putative multiple sugar transport system substrate-binding protein|uniref:Periplasmic binding protein and sugar binding domain of the LacI family protein n=2 Tax=Streptomyces ipomoeae TaxID=103232 RepID=L1KJH0_9ACTN|nr:multiple monosaccharide ABC transporter substrate-binding protein [Streptomyces ipomoeae]EKX60956.1 periplasmic binding protein and sugar binding domain of the LacI family protein [Streptomyces ipomoeae 91-03]MDX2699726.1 sugar ABC transporter substrate-binding protein [Streptomyces ipomoeae]MDX2827277.1 sugar ABC transporter substrate-binding protein [Streptomyces ipomoeae]MDX2843049.1 sugar ABC transporter substrate-binding protein [Streptomyces ipomoeae]MDX2879903.1 sugar ABC transporter